jgi:hypothetical protein
MAANEQSRDAAQALRDKQRAEFLAMQSDSLQAIGQMKAALETLSEVGADQTTAGAAADSKFMMAGFKGSLLATKVQTSVKQALIAASVLLNGKVEKKQVIESFIQAPLSAGYAACSRRAHAFAVQLVVLSGFVERDPASLMSEATRSGEWMSRWRLKRGSASSPKAPFTGTYTAQSGEVVGILKETLKSTLRHTFPLRDARIELFTLYLERAVF